ncbi:hypothetical protein KI387_030991 [Taxus chinensis]|uniref:Uncharacterized protein n=1 Tax=Taxus chinensis TaxID=29808 RepID=A0AA38CMP9_TAXCH|nr:hypothetical protein KI387_030991 [Taxus chinensis]
MAAEKQQEVGAEASKKPAGTILHQRGRLGLSKYSTATLALAGIAVVAVVGSVSLYILKKPEKSASEVAKSTVGTSPPPTTKGLPRPSRFGSVRPKVNLGTIAKHKGHRLEVKILRLEAWEMVNVGFQRMMEDLLSWSGRRLVATYG